MSNLQFPEIRFCPSCGSDHLAEKFDGWQDDAEKHEAAFGECAECGTHFRVSGFYRFYIGNEFNEEGA